MFVLQIVVSLFVCTRSELFLKYSQVFQTYSQDVHAISNILATMSEFDVKAFQQQIDVFSSSMKSKSYANYILTFGQSLDMHANIRKEEQLSAKSIRFRCVFNSTALTELLVRLQTIFRWGMPWLVSLACKRTRHLKPLCFRLATLLSSNAP